LDYLIAIKVLFAVGRVSHDIDEHERENRTQVSREYKIEDIELNICIIDSEYFMCILRRYIDMNSISLSTFLVDIYSGVIFFRCGTQSIENYDSMK
jgi:hypothetical protein